MTAITPLSKRDSAAFFRVVEDSLSVDRPEALAEWLSGGIQEFVPHDMLLTAWGDFSLDLVHSALVSRRHDEPIVDARDLMLQPALPELFERWERNRLPFVVGGEGEPFGIRSGADGVRPDRLARVRSAIVHGIKDERGHHDCLYLVMSDKETFPKRTLGSIRLLLPYIDTVLRQARLPGRRANPEATATADAAASRATPQSPLQSHLSQRELEIMRWVCGGKTNSEIGQILDISFFTVKNHLQRIFRKMDVLNRAQAVAKFERPP